MTNSLLLDLILKSVIICPDFNDKNEDTWKKIQYLCSASSVHEVKSRYKELLEFPPEWLLMVEPQTNSQQPIDFSKQREKTMDSKEAICRPSSSSSIRKNTTAREDNLNFTDNKSGLKPLTGPGPTMVIHVCDEAKGVKQDFYCPRDLLVKEMRYFAEYLSLDQQRWEEVDISVHCDVHIFDWLMRYVKRNNGQPNANADGGAVAGGDGSPNASRPRSSCPSDTAEVASKLEPSNVVSILISSHFLKMDTLVEQCIVYCHDNMNAILAAPCNMNCITDELVLRIADKFTDVEADEIKDRKDKFKSKIFSKKIEKLFDPNFKSPECPENASTLYKCSACQRLVTRGTEKRSRCLDTRLAVDGRGCLISRHQPDPSWDASDYIAGLREELPSWREVYWRLWGSVTWLVCQRCGDTFTGRELSHCQYHPKPPVFDPGTVAKMVAAADPPSNSVSSLVNNILADEKNSPPPVPFGMYPCCNMKVYRFNCMPSNSGCQTRDHLISGSQGSQPGLMPNCHVHTEAIRSKLCEALLAHRDIICTPYQPQNQENVEAADIFTSEQLIFERVKRNTILSDEAETKSGSKEGPRLQPLTFEMDDEEFSGGSSDDDEIGDEEVHKKQLKRKPRITVQTEAILMDGPQFLTKKAKKWDTGKSMRANQDAQRQEDLRRTKQMVEYLTKLRLNIDKNDKVKPKEYLSGIFGRLEIQWKAQHCPPIAKIPPVQSLRGKGKLLTPFR